jgi:dihydrofolate reductase
MAAMGKVVVNTSLTLDGVMQAPGRPDEDRRGGFEHGGWALPYFDAVMAGEAAKGMATESALLFGRRTYEDFYSVWPKREGNPFTEVLNNSRKYVASTTLREPLPWANSTLLAGDAAAAVADLKQRSDTDFVVLGSGVLVRSLMQHGLVDELVLSIHPLVLGSGRRLFEDGGPYATLELVDAKPTTTGVIIATYRPGAPPPPRAS